MRLILLIVVALVAGIDTGVFHECLTGPVESYSNSTCGSIDIDYDGDIDLFDWADWVLNCPGDC